MNIDNIKSNFVSNNNQSSANSKTEKNHVYSKEKQLSDRLEISKEAHQLQEETLVQIDLDEIKEKVENNYYDDPAIIEKVAELILKEIAG